MITQQINSEQELYDRLAADIEQTNRQSVKILGGHFPMIYDHHQVQFGVKKWGCFALHTFDLSARLAVHAHSTGKKVGIMVICDDHYYKPQKGTPWHREPRNKIYRENRLPEGYEQILAANNLDHKVLVEHNHGKIGRERCKVISENVVLAEAQRKGIQFESDCAKVYAALVANLQLFNSEEDYLIGFIPRQCKNNICNFLDTTSNLPNSHVFFMVDETLWPANPSRLYEKWEDGESKYDIFYRKQ